MVSFLPKKYGKQERVFNLHKGKKVKIIESKDNWKKLKLLMHKPDGLYLTK
jgi:hypothetical protein